MIVHPTMKESSNTRKDVPNTVPFHPLSKFNKDGMFSSALPPRMFNMVTDPNGTPVFGNRSRTESHAHCVSNSLPANTHGVFQAAGSSSSALSVKRKRSSSSSQEDVSSSSHCDDETDSDEQEVADANSCREGHALPSKVPIQQGASVSNSLPSKLPRLFSSLIPHLVDSVTCTSQHHQPLATYSPSEEYCIHKCLAEKSSSTMESLSWEIDFAIPVGMTSSVSPITCLDDLDCEDDDESADDEAENRTSEFSSRFPSSFERLVQRDLGVDEEMAKSLCARNREKERLRPMHFCDYVGRNHHPEFNAFERSKLVDSMLHIAKRFFFDPSTVFLAVSITDQFLSKVRNIPKHDLLEVGIAALLLCYKLERGTRRKFPMDAILIYCDFVDAAEREEFARLIRKREVAIFSAIGLDPYSTTNLWDFISEFTGVAYPGIFTSRSSLSSTKTVNDVQDESSSATVNPSAGCTTQTRSSSIPSHYYERLKLVLCICERALLEYDIMMGHPPSTIVLAAIALADALCPAMDGEHGKAPSPCSITDPSILQQEVNSDGDCSGNQSQSCRLLPNTKPQYNGMNKVLMQHVGFESEHDLSNAGVLSCIKQLQMKFRQESFNYALVYAKRIFHAATSDVDNNNSQRDSEIVAFDYLQWLRLLEEELAQSAPSNMGSIANGCHQMSKLQRGLEITSASLSNYRWYLSLLPAIFESMVIHQKLVVPNVTPISSTMSSRASPLSFGFGPSNSNLNSCRGVGDFEDNYTVGTPNLWSYPQSNPSNYSSSSGATTLSSCSAASTFSVVSAACCWGSESNSVVNHYSQKSNNMSYAHAATFSPVGINTSHSSMGIFSSPKSVPLTASYHEPYHAQQQRQQSPWSVSTSTSTAARSPYSTLFSPTRPHIRYSNAETKERRWQDLVAALNQTIRQADLDEDEPLKGVRLRYRSVYHKLILCPPLT